MAQWMAGLFVSHVGKVVVEYYILVDVRHHRHNLHPRTVQSPDHRRHNSAQAKVTGHHRKEYHRHNLTCIIVLEPHSMWMVSPAPAVLHSLLLPPRRD